MIDSHVHLDDPKFGPDTPAVIARARQAGVSAMISAGVDLESSRAALALAEEHPAVYAAVGFHPHQAVKMGEGDGQQLHALAAHPKVVAIGEIGLDYYRDHSPRATQRRVFEAQLEVAAELEMPVVVHSREADQDTLEILTAWAHGAASGYRQRPLGVLHCFSGDLTSGLHYIAMGFVISLAGPVTYPNASKTRAVAAGVPLERLLVETDAPYLPPQGQRGQRNEPANLRSVLDQIAALRGLPLEAVASHTVRNTQRLFGLPTDIADDQA